MFPWWTALIGALALVALGMVVYRRNFREAPGREDRYMSERILSPEQVVMLDYLRDTFPHQVVLPNMSLRNLLTVRSASDPQRARERLRKHKVDFVVCGEDGRPMFAFDIEQYHLSDAKAKAHQVKMKNRILKTAGVRFLFLKNGIHRMPSPADFRQQLNLASLPQPNAKDGAAPEGIRQQLESKLSEFDPLYPSTGFRDSEVMGMTGLMSLEDDEFERMARQRPPSARVRAH